MNAPAADGRFDWIDEMTDAECMEVFWLYVETPDQFLSRYPPELLGLAMRRALREVARSVRGGDPPRVQA
jgi:hypothetical protein